VVTGARQVGSPRQDEKTQGRKEEGQVFIASSRPGGFAINESLIEDVATAYVDTVGATVKRGVAIDAGECGGATEAMLKGRLGAARRGALRHALLGA
jgi:hypothetical protein